MDLGFTLFNVGVKTSKTQAFTLRSLHLYGDKWRMPRVFNENMFEVYDVDHCDDATLILCMFSIVIFVSPSTRCSQSWILPVCGGLSFSLSTVLLGAPENDPFSRTRHFRDMVTSCVFTVASCMIWFSSRERERYMRLHFVGKNKRRTCSQLQGDPSKAMWILGLL